jgi:hypothetical protein
VEGFGGEVGELGEGQVWGGRDGEGGGDGVGYAGRECGEGRYGCPDACGE